MRLSAFLCFLVASVGCTGGNFKFAPGSVVGRYLVTEYYPNGMMKDQGYVGTDDQGATVKTDQWRWWFDNGQLQWQGFYVNGAIDNTREWKEWNRNGSLRDTWIDN